MTELSPEAQAERDSSVAALENVSVDLLRQAATAAVAGQHQPGEKALAQAMAVMQTAVHLKAGNHVPAKPETDIAVDEELRKATTTADNVHIRARTHTRATAKGLIK